uniref:Uncharacterized protein n=1 Tax=Knipowitschia caucasica TaxID=637954 RepID=A0AAV2LID6_KNICA
MTASESVSLWDHGNGSFTVTLSHLKTSDSGTYWCGASRPLKDTFVTVHLNIIKGFPFATTEHAEGSTITEVTSLHAYRTITNPTEEPLQTDSTTNSSKGNKVAGLDVYLPVGVAMITVIVVLVLCLRKREKKTRPHEQPLNLISHLHQVGSEEPTESEPTDRHIYENIHLHSKVSRNNHFPTYVQPLPALPKRVERIYS